jgi:hypothetical protein
MRITRAHRNSGGDTVAEPKVENGEEEEVASDSPSKSERHNQQVLISGVLNKGDQDFTPDAVRQFHTKPAPQKEKRPVMVNHNIQQPR